MQIHYIENKRFTEVKIQEYICVYVRVCTDVLLDLIFSKFYTLINIYLKI